MNSTTIPAMPHRPFGISVLALLLGVRGLGTLILLIVFLLQGLESNPLFSGIVIYWIGLILGLFCPVVAWGLWKMKSWAYWGTIVLLIANAVNDIKGFDWIQPQPHVPTIIGSFLFSLLFLLYLILRQEVRIVFLK